MQGKTLGEKSVSVTRKRHYYKYIITLELDSKGGLMLSPKVLGEKPVNLPATQKDWS